jgi:hypothetical protein
MREALILGLSFLAITTTLMVLLVGLCIVLPALGRAWRRRRWLREHMQDAPRPRVPHANEGLVSQRPEYRSRGPRRAS